MVVFETLRALILSKWAELDPETMAMPTPQSVLKHEPRRLQLTLTPAGLTSTLMILGKSLVQDLRLKRTSCDGV